MANPGYIRSTDGSDADNGSTWALANATAAGAMADQAAGDRIWLSQAHAESTAAAVTITCPGTLTAPCQILCGNDAAEPPTALATTASITTTGANNLLVAGSFYAYGITFSAGSGAVSSNLTLAGSAAHQHQKYEQCTFIHGSSASTAQNIQLGYVSSNRKSVEWTNCNLKLSGTGNQITTISTNFAWNGGSVVAGTTTPSGALFNTGSNSPYTGDIIVSGVDLSNFGSGLNLFAGGGLARGVVRNCKLPASWAGSLISGTILSPMFRAEMWNCDSADTNYNMWVEDYAGSIRSETTVVKTSGASDGTTTISWKMTSSANAEYPLITLISPEFFSAWNDTTASAKTITVDILHDSLTNLTDAEIWLEVQYLGTSGVPLGSFIDDAKADVLATAADQSTAGGTWTTTGLTNPNTQQLSVTFTPQEKGVFICRVMLAKPSYTVYVDPLAVIS